MFCYLSETNYYVLSYYVMNFISDLTIILGSSNIKHYCVATQDSELQRALKTKGSTIKIM